MSCCAPSIALCTPGPQGPPGPTGPTGPGGGGGGALSISITGNVAGVPALISSGLLMLAGGPGITLSQIGSTISFSAAAQSTQTQPAGAIAGTGVSMASQAGSTLGATLGTNGLSLGLPNWITGGGGIDVSMGGNTSGTPTLISSGTLFLAGGNNVTLVQNGNTISISANTAAAANLSVSAGTTTGAFGGLTFSNSNNLSFGLNNGTITGSVNAPGLGTTFNGANISVSMTLNSAGLNLSLSSPVESGIGLSAAGSSQSAGTVLLSNANGITFGMNGSTVTASYNSTQFAGTGTTFGGTNASASMTLNSAGLNLAISAAAGGSGASTGGVYVAGNTTGQSSSSTYPQSSLNISLAGILSGGWSSNTLIISAPGTTALALSAYAVSNTTQSTSGTVAGSALSFAGAGGVSVGVSNGSVVISGGAGGGGNTLSLYALGNTTQNSSATFNQSALSFNALGAMTWGYSNGSIQVSAPATSSISGTGIVSISVNGSTISIGANALTAYAVSNTTQATSGTVNGTALSFAGAGGVSIGVSNGSVVISGGAGGGVSTAGLYALGNTTQNSSSTLNLSALSFNGLGGMTIGYSNGSIQMSAPGSAATTAAYYFQGNTIGQSSSSTGLDQSLSISAAGIISGGWSAGTIVLSATQLSTLGLYAVGNTTQNSSTSLAQNTVSFNGLGALTVGFSNGSIQLSAPAVSSISGTGLVSIVTNGSTISIGAAIPQLSFFQPLGPVQNTTLTQNGAGSVQIYPAIAAFPFSASRADIMASVSLSALAVSTEAQTLSLYIGLYSLNGSTLSLASSGSQSYAWSNLSGNSSASLSGMRRFSAPININYTGGFDLFVGVMTNTTFANTNGISLSNVVVPLGPGPQLQGLIGQTQVNSMQFVPGQGFFSATSAALPASIGLSQILGAGSGGNAVDYYAPVQFVNATA